MLKYHSALTLFLYWSGTEAIWPDWAKKTAIVCVEVLLDLLNFTGGSSPGKTQLSPGKSQTEDCCSVSGSYWYTKGSLPVTMSLTRSDLPPSNF